jgi:hypothetical protein
LHKVLIVPLAHVRFLFPGIILSNHQRAYSLFHQQVNDVAGSLMHVVIDAPVALGVEKLHSLRRTRFSKLLLQLRTSIPA